MRQWDTTKYIITYFKELENFKEMLDTRKIATSETEMATAAVIIMNGRRYFVEDKVINWENNPEADQINMAIVKTYFIKLYRKR